VTSRGLLILGLLLVFILILLVIIVVLAALWPRTKAQEAPKVCDTPACLRAAAQVFFFLFFFRASYFPLLHTCQSKRKKSWRFYSIPSSHFVNAITIAFSNDRCLHGHATTKSGLVRFLFQSVSIQQPSRIRVFLCCLLVCLFVLFFGRGGLYSCLLSLSVVSSFGWVVVIAVVH
jgi:hypothetical protein